MPKVTQQVNERALLVTAEANSTPDVSGTEMLFVLELQIIRHILWVARSEARLMQSPACVPAVVLPA